MANNRTTKGGVTSATPLPGSRWYDREEGRFVTYLGDHGSGPRWRRDDGTWFYCDWLDFYLWGRFYEKM